MNGLQSVDVRVSLRNRWIRGVPRESTESLVAPRMNIKSIIFADKRAGIRG